MPRSLICHHNFLFGLVSGAPIESDAALPPATEWLYRRDKAQLTSHFGIGSVSFLRSVRQVRKVLALSQTPRIDKFDNWIESCLEFPNPRLVEWLIESCGADLQDKPLIKQTHFSRFNAHRHVTKSISCHWPTNVVGELRLLWVYCVDVRSCDCLRPNGDVQCYRGSTFAKYMWWELRITFWGMIQRAEITVVLLLLSRFAAEIDKALWWGQSQGIHRFWAAWTVGTISQSLPNAYLKLT